MSNFVGTLLSIFLKMLSLILILYKIDISYINPLDKSVMSKS